MEEYDELIQASSRGNRENNVFRLKHTETHHGKHTWFRQFGVHDVKSSFRLHWLIYYEKISNLIPFSLDVVVKQYDKRLDSCVIASDTDNLYFKRDLVITSFPVLHARTRRHTVAPRDPPRLCPNDIVALELVLHLKKKQLRVNITIKTEHGEVAHHGKCTITEWWVFKACESAIDILHSSSYCLLSNMSVLGNVPRILWELLRLRALCMSGRLLKATTTAEHELLFDWLVCRVPMWGIISLASFLC